MICNPWLLIMITAIGSDEYIYEYIDDSSGAKEGYFAVVVQVGINRIQALEFE